MDGLGYPHWLQQDAHRHVASAYDTAAATGTQGTVFQGPKRGRGWPQGANTDDSKRRRETDHPQASVASYEQTAMDTCPAHAVQATAPEPTRAYVSPSNAIARLLGAANALLPGPANQQAAPLHEFDVSGPARSAAQLALWAKEALQVLIQQADAATSDAQRGTLPTEQQLGCLRGKARSAASLWQQAMAAVGSEQSLSADEVLVPLAEQATQALWRAFSAIEKARRAAQRQARVHAAEEACKALSRSARAALERWAHQVPTDAEVSELHEKVNEVQAVVHGVWGTDAKQWPTYVVVANEVVRLAMTAAGEAQRVVREATAACEALKAEAMACAAEWDLLGRQAPDTSELQAHADRVAGLVQAAWPDTNARPAIVSLAREAVELAMDAAAAAAERAEAAARERVVQLARLKDELVRLRDRALADAATWRDKPPSDRDKKALVEERDALGNRIATYPYLSAHSELYQEVRSAVSQALEAAYAAAARERGARRAELEAQLVQLRDRALAAAVAWRDTPPAFGEKSLLSYELDALRSSLLQHRPCEVLDALFQEVRSAVKQAWDAAEAAVAAERARDQAAKQAAQQALEAFTQQALLCRARWAREGRQRPPRRDKYKQLQRQYEQALELARKALPVAYAYVFAVRMHRAPPGPVPLGQAQAVARIGQAKRAVDALRDTHNAWLYVLSMHKAAQAA